MKSVSIGIIGMGWVGSSTAISILNKGICNNLLLNDLRDGIAEGEAMDLNHGSAFFPTAKVFAASVQEMLSCDAIVITAGRGGKPGESRLQLLNENVAVAKKLSQELKGYHGILVVVANPVDVLTYFYQEFTEIPKERVIGTGTLLDTARLREMIGQRLSVAAKSIHAQVVGEHGDSEVVLWSGATVGGVPLQNWSGWTPQDEQSIKEKVRLAAYEIIKRKGATNHAIGLVTANLLKWLLRNEQRVVNISSVMPHPKSGKNIAFSLPTLLGSGGIVQVMQPPMNTTELDGLLHSADVLRAAIESVTV
jgi:L-lactate dehydrogenase